ncbi:hypothetical protein B6A27_05905 [Anoxybacillus sp. UARK-01]|uniref:RAMP superfamily CRISPR-associated protein n=1 Tax=Anoxybacillus sp. UARK-01 TaxID=1895648 RepID=UPI0009BA1C8F|nr:RAMP superfamily CRISPR-associated protein [Anoxybacillus sp. UARK-01]OQM46685.1 hypothetical protein B6A27_05905 [Anoxybacillus sp. UARK-01]
MESKKETLQWYRIVLKPLSPLHIGKKNYGVLSETRIFIPGWTIWGAFVNGYGKLNGGTEDAFNNGKRLFEKITCFFPCTSVNDVWFPNFQKGSLCLGDFSEQMFRAKYTDVYVSTAINPAHLSAQDTSLHELEVILPKAKTDEREPIFWQGLIGIKLEDEKGFNDMIDKVEEWYVGGEISYGFGKMKVENVEKVTNFEEDWGFRKDGTIDVGNNMSQKLRNYICFSDAITLINGKMELIVQYDFTQSFPTIASQHYGFVPGSKISVSNEDEKQRSFVLKKGLFVLEDQ